MNGNRVTLQGQLRVKPQDHKQGWGQFPTFLLALLCPSLSPYGAAQKDSSIFYFLFFLRKSFRIHVTKFKIGK